MPRFTSRAGPPAAVGSCAAYDSTNPVHAQAVAEVTESPMPTTKADRGAIVIAGVAADLGFAVAVVTATGAGARARPPTPGRLACPVGLTPLGMPQVAVVNKAVVNSRAAAASQTWLPRACNLPRSAMSTYFDADGSAVVPRTSGVTSLVPVRAFVSFSHMRSPLRVRAPQCSEHDSRRRPEGRRLALSWTRTRFTVSLPRVS